MDLRQEDYSFTRENFNILLSQNVQLFEENEHLKINLEATEKKLNWLTEQICLTRQRQFNNKSECGKFLQLELVFDEIPDADDNEEGTTGIADKELSDTETITYTRKKKAVGRRIDTSKLPREVVIHDLSESEKTCDKCDKVLEKFGEDRSEQLEYIPAQVKVIEHVVPKYMAATTILESKKILSA